MRSVDAIGRDACAFQGRVFELSGSELPRCSSAVFVRRFMRSELARRVDERGSFDSGSTVEGVIVEVDAEYGGRPYGTALYPREALYWMGYTYRYWTISAGTTSKHAHAICGAREMLGLYEAYHTLDPAQCVERILEAKGQPTDAEDEDELMRRGVEALRRIRARRTQPDGK